MELYEKYKELIEKFRDGDSSEKLRIEIQILQKAMRICNPEEYGEPTFLMVKNDLGFTFLSL